MPGPFSQIYEPQNSSVYAPIDIGAFTNAFATVRQRYDKNLENISAWDNLAETLDVGDNPTAQAAKNAAINSARESIDQYVKKGNYENAELGISKMARTFAADPMLQTVLRGHAEYKKARDFQIQNGGRYLDFNPYDKHNFYNEDGTANPYYQGTEGILDYDKTKNSLLDTIKELGGPLGLTRVDLDGLDHYLKYGDWSGVKPDRAAKMQALLAEYYINNTDEGRQEFNRYTKPNNLNNFDPEKVLTEQQAKDEIFKSFRQLGAGRVGTTSKYNYTADPIRTKLKEDAIDGTKDAGTFFEPFYTGLINNKGTTITNKFAEAAFGKEFTPGTLLIEPASGNTVADSKLVYDFSKVERTLDAIGVNLDEFLEATDTGKGYHLVQSNSVKRGYSPPTKIPEEVRRQVYHTFNLTPETYAAERRAAGKNIINDGPEGFHEWRKTKLREYRKLAQEQAPKIMEDAKTFGTLSDKIAGGEFHVIEDGKENIVIQDGQAYLRGVVHMDYTTLKDAVGNDSGVTALVKKGIVKKVSTSDTGENIYQINAFRPVEFNESAAATIEKEAGGGAKQTRDAANFAKYTNRNLKAEANAPFAIYRVFEKTNIGEDDLRKMIDADQTHLLNKFTPAQKDKFYKLLNFRIASAIAYNSVDRGEDLTKEDLTEVTNLVKKEIFHSTYAEIIGTSNE
jgi:hypothetical protein